ncbi:DUF86 domain-containing protein [bacterium]|nr:DUF86 domain-containing protein [bacterium]
MQKDLFEPVVRKLRLMLAFLDELSGELPEQKTDYLNAPTGKHRAVERLCQLVVECSIDANSLLVIQSGGNPPTSARDSFTAAHKLGGIAIEIRNTFHYRFVPLRNRLVHVYEDIDNERVYDSAQSLLNDGRRYIQQMTAYLEQQERDTASGS